MQTSTVIWGTAAPGDAGDTRRTRGLGLGSAVRAYNDLAVPGLGGLWFAKPLVWSLIGIRLGGGAEGSRIEVANATEVLAMMHALSSKGEAKGRVNGKQKLGRLAGKFPTFEAARAKSLYVTVPFRQGMTQPLRAFGMVESDIQRFNAYSLTALGSAVLDAAVGRKVLDDIRDWMGGTSNATRMGAPRMRAALSPLEDAPLPAQAAELLLESLIKDGRRRRARDWLRRIAASKAEVSWQERPDGVESDHWWDIRDGARFFLMRAGALAVLDAVENLLRVDRRAQVSLAEAAKAAAGPVMALRALATEFLSGVESRADRDRAQRVIEAEAFAAQASAPDGSTVIEFLVRRDGRGLRLLTNAIGRGSAFNPGGSSPVDAGDEEAAAPEDGELHLPPGTSVRLRSLHSLDRDLETLIGLTPGATP